MNSFFNPTQIQLRYSPKIARSSFHIFFFITFLYLSLQLSNFSYLRHSLYFFFFLSSNGIQLMVYGAEELKSAWSCTSIRRLCEPMGLSSDKKFRWGGLNIFCLGELVWTLDRMWRPIHATVDGCSETRSVTKGHHLGIKKLIMNSYFLSMDTD